MAKWVYLFSEGNASMRELLGGKGANLAEMTKIGLPVPQGFTITTEACTQYYEDGRKINDEIMAQVMEGVAKMEEINGKKFGDHKNPLLVSVRSGARASMPGMMDTILNLGLNDDVVAAMIAGNPDPTFERFVYDSYRRFIQMFSDVVMEVGKKYFEKLIDEMKEAKGVKTDIELTAADLKTLAEQFKAEYKNQLGSDFPADPVEQLKLAIEAVFRSWDNPRANVYRRDNDIPYSWGTAVNVMPMVFGNLNDQSGTGVAFTRDPATGENKLMGEFLINAQGEDVVAGVRTPMPIAQMEEEFPEAYAEFIKVCELLENHYHDMQDMEFTVENKKLYMLQCRNGKRTAPAALQIACDLVDEGHKTEEEAVLMIDPRNLDTLLHPQFDAKTLKAATPIGKGLGASPGAACGKVVFTADDAVAWAEKGEKVVLVRLETSPEDITGMKAAQGILTVRGGMTSHAAVVARGMGTCCVSGCGDILMDEENKKFTLAGQVFTEGSEISIDGTTGNIYAGIIPTVDASIDGNFGRVMGWADKFRKLKVRTNADTPADAKKARELGAEGIGLCRTEHMFFEEERIAAFREMICADTVEERETALDKILPYQQSDFEKLYEALEGNPVCIRFLDPPLHEFVPTEDADIQKLADAQGKTVEQIRAIIDSLHEFNPMMGHRGCRLAVTYPEIAKMQTKAVIRAAINVSKAHPEWTIKPEIMIPLVGEVKELKYVKNFVVETADAEIAAAGVNLEYEVGTMIEIPRAALTADEIATEADFFCFGTNDLTQMAFGFSRDDAGKFLGAYYDAKIYENDPFAKLDQTGVGKLMDMAIKLGRPVNPALHVGICGEHGGDPSSVEFCHKLGLDYVSCSPYRVPIARLAAAQAAISEAR
ncbi:pyruvate, phosphate dikinase [Fusibacillus kribbianus]|uniref:Pyruvate, phosphate dikinase n=1 Tax=Fusibacillus kribbianus TaxID=3044208 RepID=A0AAP4EW44_9FIRM|nr:pyruvate, phosphate dikinase [Ruminococcus sp. YH-rum2234]MDI9241089.1 pyruvate, phosphate dikinase [Ruminococcus sp. YH-rum2234]